MSTCIVLGPDNAYFFNAPKRSAFDHLPQDVTELMKRRPQIRDIREMALGPEGSFLVVYIDHNGIDRIMYRDLPVGLKGWLIKNGSSVRDHASLQCSLRPNGAYFAFDNNGSIRGNLPVGMENACKERLLPSGNWKTGAFPASVTFGPDGHLRGILVVLSPSNSDHWILVNYNGIGRVDGDVEEAAIADFNNFEADLQEVVRNERIQVQAHASRQAQSRTINTGIKIGFKVLGAALGAGVSAGGGGPGSAGDVSYVPPTYVLNTGGSDFWTPIQSAASDPIQ
ncbi:hypothetical protein GQ53DRAFT_762695 [Thozetella sp. PMI_491]|nr:hypothetical protein GQ53DRAFT_762695 [Thozetella sp. PMI_491]